MKTKSSNAAGMMVLILSIFFFIAGALYAYSNYFDRNPLAIPADFLAGLSNAVSGKQERVYPPGQLDFIDHVKSGLSAAYLYIDGKPFPMKADQAGLILKKAFSMEVDLKEGLRVKDIPPEVRSGSKLLCRMDFKAAKAQTIYQILLYKNEEGKIMAAIKRPRTNKVYAGQYEAAALHAQVNALAGNLCN